MCVGELYESTDNDNINNNINNAHHHDHDDGMLNIVERDEAAISALHNLFTEEDRLLKYLTSPMDGDYEFVVPK